MSKIKLTKKQARQFLLVYQGLCTPYKWQGKAGILEYIRKVGCIQYDPLNKVGRNPDLVLQARIKNYNSNMLQELLYTDRKLLDGWDKNMSIYAVEDWPYFHRYREEAKQLYDDASTHLHSILPKVREEIEQKGAISSIDLKFDMKVDWAWAPTRAARAALESMFFWGELIIHHKAGTRKFYDFSERSLSSKLLAIPDPNQTLEEYFDWIVKRRIGAIGLLWEKSGDAWLGTKWLKSKERLMTLSRLENRGEIISYEVEGIDYPFYIRKEELSLINEVLESLHAQSKVTFIAPLDNIIWDRKLLKQIFGFEYTWEVYTPKSIRKYGYYVLPVLYEDRFIARFEPIFNKSTKELVIENWWWEDGMRFSKQFEKSLIEAFIRFSNYLGANCIQFNSEELVKKLPSLQKINLSK